MEEEAGNQEAELKIGVGALELCQPESQMSESAPNTSHELHLKSGTINSERILIWGGGGRIKACSIGGSIPPRNVLHLLLMTSDTLYYIKQFSEGGGSGGGGGV